MKTKQTDFWIGEKDLNRDPELIAANKVEFLELPIIEALSNEEVVQNQRSSRRDFLKYLGFGIGAATVAASCEIPVKKAIPYVIKPDTIVPGVATYYASSFVNGGDYCPVLVKTREGRPIKIEGNDLAEMTNGGTSARAQAMVLSLYDTNRYEGPLAKDGEEFSAISWDDLDQAVKNKLNATSNIRIVAPTIISPTTLKTIEDFKIVYPNADLVMYDAISLAGMLDANQASFGKRVIPNYHFDKADLIVSFNADFLGTWVSPVEFSRQYAKNRVIEDPHHAKMSQHVQIESNMSMTGSNADNRILIKPSQMGEAIKYVYNSLMGSGGSAGSLDDKATKALDALSNALQQNSGKALVVSGSNNPAEQMLINAINNAIGSYGNTIDLNGASLQRKGDDKALRSLVSEMNSGRVDALLLMGANPVYDIPDATDFKEGMNSVGLKVSFAGSADETTVLCDYIAPDSHILESWGDVEAKEGTIGLIQPTISPIFNTRQKEASLLTWADSASFNKNAEQPVYEYLKMRWENEVYPASGSNKDFRSFWDASLHDGLVSIAGSEEAASFAGDANSAARSISSSSTNEGAIEVALYESVNMGAGQYADNPWLQEMPDPVMRTVWGNYLTIPVSWDGDRRFLPFEGLKDGELVNITVNGQTFKVPVIVQFGQAKGTVGLALGYGRTVAGKTGTEIGANMFSILPQKDGYTQYSATIEIEVTGEEEDHFSCVQYHHTMGVTGIDNASGEIINADEAAIVDDAFKGFAKGYQGSLTDRTILRRTSLDEVETFAHDLQHERGHHQGLNERTLYPGFEESLGAGHHWGMHIDLNACTGCSACTVACMAENNVPVVGKVEVARHHEMTWLRIDRYYYGDLENPRAVYQPMMCQHCDNAPCENVCPVNATNHSSEGLNQMAYNRCVGTRYCANNCPFKVRRFNWLDYTTADLFPANEKNIANEDIPFGADNLTRMVLNPDVTVRSRGVIEKCSFCVQRIQEGKLSAKTEGRTLRDADVRTACQTACPTGAITFGDLNNKAGELSKKLDSDLNYIVLEEVNTAPSVNYSAVVDNPIKELEA